MKKKMTRSAPLGLPKVFNFPLFLLVTFTLFSGVDVGVLRVDLSKCKCDVKMSLLRPQQASDWITDPYWMCI